MGFGGWPKHLDNFEARWANIENPNGTTPMTLATSRPQRDRVYLDLEYGIYQPFGAFNRMWWNFGANHNQLYAPRVYSNWNWEAEWPPSPKRFGSTS